MRKIYLTVLIVFAVSVFLFFVSFVYLDKHNHKVFFYSIALDGKYNGTIKVDRFVTEEKRIYKSTAAMPFRELFTEARSRIDLDSKYNLEYYQKELFVKGGSAPAAIVCTQQRNNLVSFLSRYGSRFICIDGIPVRKGTFVFEEDSPVTYLPIIENYVFNVGWSQGFNSIIYLPDPKSPPIKRFVTLTSIASEYVKIGRRKIATDKMLLKIKGLPQGSIWVAKSDRSLVAVELPSLGLKIMRSFEPGETMPKERRGVATEYISQDVVFYGKSGPLSGTLTTPIGGGKNPAVLLIWGAGPQDRDYQGFFASISDYLSRNGYAVLRFDKKGVGASAGDILSETQDGELEDVAAAYKFLKEQNSVDPLQISLLAHSEGAFNAMRLSSTNPEVKSIILMAPVINTASGEAEAILVDKAARDKWDDSRLKMALQAVKDTRQRADKTKRDWGYVLGKKCYLKDVRQDGALKSVELLEKISAPVLILYGKDDSDIPAKYTQRLDKFISEHGMMKRTVVYCGYLGHFFGMLSNDGYSRMCYEVDKEVLGKIKVWLDS